MIELNPEIESANYRNHLVFRDLDLHMSFYDSLAESTFHWVTRGTRAIANIDSYIFSSMSGTLESVKLTLSVGRINDAYALLRKYYDSAIINIYANLYLADHFCLDNLIVAQINDWLKGTSQLPEFRIMSQYIRGSDRVKSITKILHVDDRYKKLRSRCNDHTHYNFYKFVLLNDNQVSLPSRLQTLSQLHLDLLDVFVLHFAYLFSINEHYMMSRDYVDSIECGIAPAPDSEFWVCPYVREVFDNTISSHRSDIAAYFLRTCNMHLQT